MSVSLTAFTLFTIPLLVPKATPGMWWFGLIVLLLSMLSLNLTIFGVVLLILGSAAHAAILWPPG